MELDVDKMTTVVRKLVARKPYAAPKVLYLNPAAVKSLISRNAVTNEIAFQQPIESVDQCHGAKGS